MRDKWIILLMMCLLLIKSVCIIIFNVQYATTGSWIPLILKSIGGMDIKDPTIQKFNGKWYWLPASAQPPKEGGTPGMFLPPPSGCHPSPFGHTCSGIAPPPLTPRKIGKNPWTNFGHKGWGLASTPRKPASWGATYDLLAIALPTSWGVARTCTPPLHGYGNRGG